MSFYNAVNKMSKGLYILGVAALLAGCTTINTRGPAISAGNNTPPVQTQTGNPLASLKGGVVSQLNGISLSAAEKQQALIAEYNALEKIDPNQSLAWNGSANGAAGQVTPFQPYRVGKQNCRAYTHSITKNGESAMGRGTACRNDNGAWEFLL